MLYENQSVQSEDNSDLRQRRDLMIALAEQMDHFFSKDNDLIFDLESFNYWCGLAGISQYQIIFQKQELL